MRKDEAWRVEVLYLCGFNIDAVVQIFHLLGDTSVKRGPVNRVVTQKQLAALRASELRVPRLLELASSAGTKDIGFVLNMARRSALAAREEMKGLGSYVGRLAHAIELRARVDLPGRLEQLAGPVESRDPFILQKSRRSTLQLNIANCPLEFMRAKGTLPEWAYVAGTRFRADNYAASVGNLRSIDFTKDVVDGGTGVEFGGPAADALWRLRDIRSAIEFAYRDDAGRTIHLLQRVAVEGRSLRAVTQEPGWRGRLRAKELSEALEPVGYVYRMAPTGFVSRRLRAWVPPSEESRARKKARDDGFDVPDAGLL